MTKSYDELTLLALINDDKKFKNKELMEFFSELNSLEEFLTSLINYDMTNIYKTRSTISKKIELIAQLYSKIDIDIYEQEIRRIKNSDINIIPFYSKLYPEKLKNISDPPLILYHRGSLINFDHCVAIVGARNLSHYGHKMAREISRNIAENNYTIVSGLARGTDTESHCGALDVEGKTIAVLAGHVEDIYPNDNLKLSSDILASGAILSEISAMGQVHKGRFIERNRLISGLSQCLIIIESEGRGGTLKQAYLAIGQGRKVFIMRPLEKDKDSVKGFNTFLRLGAIPFESAEIILEFLDEAHLNGYNATLDYFCTED